jgi:hypothetical protein
VILLVRVAELNAPDEFAEAQAAKTAKSDSHKRR